jgi:hypothetical protein
LQVSGNKDWTLCHPLNASERWPAATAAELAQLHEILDKGKSNQGEAGACLSFSPEADPPTHAATLCFLPSRLQQL